MVRIGKIILALLCAACLVACGPETKVKVGYRPPFVPVGLEFDSDMHISIARGFDINADGPVTMCLDGQFRQSITRTRIEIAVLNGASRLDLLPGAAGQDACRTTTPPPTKAAQQRQVSGTWQGTYVCAQGETGLRLKLTGNKNGEVTATFTFYPIGTNPGVPKGSFTMRGRYADTVISLTQDRWIDQLPGYMLVDLTGTFDGDRLEGSVSAGCGRFAVRRVVAGS